ncbi:unnamed protein product [Didymodactylos carnosus]|uniref:HAT C-terminal dimerisation domain-containing protein n=1 Tax=Didymodactylos carnosus TaxID=1234261 RepID=A0A8S2FRZ3_9BILA|nr:unnamed protein product [Didymodactylos carnosus]CAF4332417.1 unnamed protein product [Didymodactylos carnosus]
MGLCIFSLAKIESYLKNDISNDDAVNSLKFALYEKYKQYFVSDGEQRMLLFFIAYFDPLGYAVLADDDKKLIEKEIISSSNNNITVVTPMPKKMNETSVKKGDNVLFDFLGSLGQTKPNASSKTLTVREELMLYSLLAIETYNMITSKGKIPHALDFWRTHGDSLPILQALAYKYLSTSPTSVPPESAFSTASYLARKQRSRLNVQTLCWSMYLKDKIVYNDE